MPLPSLNASSLLKCLFKPKGRAWAAGGGPVASNTKLIPRHHTNKPIGDK